MSEHEFTIWIDNDACPRRVREVVFGAARRLKILLKIVANSYAHPPAGIRAEVIVVDDGFDAADNHIADEVNAGDMVITADIPLADRVVAKQALALSPRGQIYDAASIKEILAMRNLKQELRSAGDISGGPSAYGDRDIKAFASSFDRNLTKLLRASERLNKAPKN